MGDEPAFIDGIAMEAAGELVVNAAAGHFFEGGFGHGEQMSFFRLLIALKDGSDSRGVRAVRGTARTGVLDFEKMGDRCEVRVKEDEVEVDGVAGEDVRVIDG